MKEGVQRRAPKFILNYPSDCYKERLTKLNLLPLEYRRDMKYLIFLFKGKLGLFNIELSDYVKLRPIPKYDLRAYNVNIFSEFKCRTVYFRNSYFPRVVRKWNSLESNIKSLSSIDSFKSKLRQPFLSNLSHYELPNQSISGNYDF